MRRSPYSFPLLPPAVKGPLHAERKAIQFLTKHHSKWPHVNRKSSLAVATIIVAPIISSPHCVGGVET